MSYIVVLEWDGDKPPTTFYNRMRKLGLLVRGDKDISPLKRRAMYEGSVIAQEGAIICSSQSLANLVAIYAQQDGAKNVMIATATPVEFHASQDDVNVLNKVEAIYGKRGRPSGEKQNWAITCLEECKSYQSEDEAYAVGNCPYCRGAVIKTIPGDIPVWKMPDGDVFEAWTRHRFAGGEFFISHESDQAAEPPAKANITHVAEAKTVEMMRNSADFIVAINKMPRHTAIRVLDAVLASRTHMRYETRKENRVKSAIYLFERNADPKKVSLSEPTDKVDLLDAGTIAGAENIGSLWLSIR